MTQHRERILAAIADAATIAGDESVDRESTRLYTDLESDLAGLLRDGDRPRLAFHSVVPVDGRRHTALTVLLEDRIVIAWRSGLLRRRFASLTVPYSTVAGISSRCVAPNPSLGGNPIVTLDTGRSLVIAIPPKGSPLGLAVRNAVINAMGAHRR